MAQKTNPQAYIDSAYHYLYDHENFKLSKFWINKAEKSLLTKANTLQKFNLMYFYGNLYHELGDKEKSINSFKQALEFAKLKNDNNLIIRGKRGLGSAYFHFNLIPEAKKIYINLAKNYLKQNDSTNYANTLSVLGNLQRKQGDFSNAFANLNKAYNIQLKIKDVWRIVNTTRFLSMYYTETGNYKLAEKLIEESDQVIKKNKYDSEINKTLIVRQRLAFASKNFTLGDELGKLINLRIDSARVKKREKEMVEFEARLKTAEKEAKLKEAQLEISQKRNWIIGLSLGFLGIMVTGGLLWRISTIKTKAKETEKLKNLEIENQKKLLSAKEIERQRIAKELHDSVGSQLTVVSTSLDNAFYLFENQKLKPEKLENISVEVRLAAQSLRDTIWATYNSEISVADLRSRIQEFVKKFSDENSFNVEISINGEGVVLTPIEGLNLFRIVQEALNNTQKYASASLVKINADFSEKNYVLEIADNGKGFDLEQNKVSESYGLNNMKTRAEEIDGKIEIKSTVGGGTAIIFEKT
ncbi:tetratricopeptide repeat-containing sensor histidine kinase [Lacihabitans soyangensis]|nr:sensor histidine kinase [Lacihabitans soyangensis]